LAKKLVFPSILRILGIECPLMFQGFMGDLVAGLDGPIAVTILVVAVAVVTATVIFIFAPFLWPVLIGCVGVAIIGCLVLVCLTNSYHRHGKKEFLDTIAFFTPPTVVLAVMTATAIFFVSHIVALWTLTLPFALPFLWPVLVVCAAVTVTGVAVAIAIAIVHYCDRKNEAENDRRRSEADKEKRESQNFFIPFGTIN
jgi:uncharacterized integral membrane protein